MNKQIEQMAFTDVDILANDINQHCADLKENYCGDTHCVSCLANALYNAGYRKQREGEWIYYDCVSSYDGLLSGYSCSCCCAFIDEEVYEHPCFANKYCPNCGAKMKGADYERK